MVKRSPPAPDEPDPSSLSDLAKAIDACRRCPLWQNATQGVPGEGAAHARIMLIGEQPGDQEDMAGRPFVGPAGKLLDKALLGPSVRVTVDRGKWLESDLAEHVMVTVHPSSILRVPREDFDDAYAALVRDFELLAKVR